MRQVSCELSYIRILYFTFDIALLLVCVCGSVGGHAGDGDGIAAAARVFTRGSRGDVQQRRRLDAGGVREQVAPGSWVVGGGGGGTASCPSATLRLAASADDETLPCRRD